MIKIQIFCISLIALVLQSNSLFAQTDSNADTCATAKKSLKEEDIKKCLEEDLNQKNKTLVDKFKKIRPLKGQDSTEPSPAPEMQPHAPPPAAPQAITPVQPVVTPPQPSTPPAQETPRPNIYNY